MTKLTQEKNKVRGPSPKVGHQYASTKRIKSTHEKMSSTITGFKRNRSEAYKLGGKTKNDNITCIKNITAKESCGFFSGNHRVPTCDLKKSLGEPMDGIKLISYMKEDAPYSLLSINDRDKIIYDNISDGKRSQHIKIHMVHSKFSPSPGCNPQHAHMACTVTLFNKFGHSVPGYHRCYVEFNKVIDYINKFHTQKKRYMFCAVEQESVGNMFYAHIPPVIQQQNTYMNTYPGMMQLSQMSQSSMNSMNMGYMYPPYMFQQNNQDINDDLTATTSNNK